MRPIDGDNLRGRVCERFLCAEPSSEEERRFAIVLGLIDSELTIAPPPNDLSAPMRFCNFSPNTECKKMASKSVQPLNNYTCRFRPSSLKCTDKLGLDGLQADKSVGN